MHVLRMERSSTNFSHLYWATLMNNKLFGEFGKSIFQSVIEINNKKLINKPEKRNSCKFSQGRNVDWR